MRQRTFTQVFLVVLCEYTIFDLGVVRSLTAVMFSTKF